MEPHPPLLVLAGPTCCGKSELALALCTGGGGEILCADSAVVYRGLDVGTAKPSAAERAAVPHHLLDVRDPAESFSVAEYRQLAAQSLAEVAARGRAALLVGGTGLYIRQVLEEPELPPVPPQPPLRAALQARPAAELFAELAATDPAGAARIHPHDTRRVIRALEVLAVTGSPISAQWRGRPQPDRQVCYLVLDRPREVLRQRIAARTEAMLEHGLVTEVQGLLAAGVPASAQSLQALGYRQTVAYLEGASDLAGLRAAIVAATAQYAKRQRTWWRREPVTAWLDLGDEPAVAALGRVRALWAGTG